MPEGRGADDRAGHLEGGERARGAGLLAGAGALELLVELVHAAQQLVVRDAAVLQDHLGGVAGADADLGLLVALAQARGLGADHERGLAAVAELGVDGGDDHVHVGDAAVGDEDLGAVQDPLVAVELGGGAQALDVGARLRLGHGVGAELDLIVGAEALRDPAGDLLGRARGGEAGGREARAVDRQGDAGAAPVHLLGGDDAELAVGVGAGALQVVEAVQAPLARLLDGIPGRALLAVVLVRDGADHLAREPPDVVLELPVLIIQREIHALGLPLAAD